MIDRKAALVGCRSGQWVRTHGMKGLRLNAKASGPVMLRIHQLRGDVVGVREVPAGVHQLDQAPWTKVEVIEGAHAGVLCLLETS